MYFNRLSSFTIIGMSLHSTTLLSFFKCIFCNAIRENNYEYLEVYDNVLIFHITNEAVSPNQHEWSVYAICRRIGLNALSKILIGIAKNPHRHCRKSSSALLKILIGIAENPHRHCRSPIHAVRSDAYRPSDVDQCAATFRPCAVF